MAGWRRTTGGGVAAALMAAALATDAGAQACPDPQATAGALDVELLSQAPEPLCEPTFRVLQVRNGGDAPLGEIIVDLTPPGDPSAYAILPGAAADGSPFEISEDDGATWRALAAPPGDPRSGAPYRFSSDLAVAFDRLGPVGDPDDSILIRWRSVVGDGVGPGAQLLALDAGDDGDERGAAPVVRLAGRGVDRCGAPSIARPSTARVTALRPLLGAEVEGRNLTRGGGFSAQPSAAPGDLIEWRVAVSNVGDAIARNVRLSAVGTDGGPIAGLVLADGAADLRPVGRMGVVSAPQVAPGGRAVVVLRQRVGPSCARRVVQFEPSWGCAAPAEGAAAAFVNALAAARATLDTAPGAESAQIEIRFEDAGGAGRPGDRAIAVMRLETLGAPLLEATATLTPPDGYALDASREIEARAGLEPLDAEVVERRPDGSIVLRLRRADGSAASVDPGAPIDISAPFARVRGGLVGVDVVTARAGYSNGCGELFESRAARAEVRPRQARLDVATDPGAPPVVAGVGDGATFGLTLENVGDAVARDATVEVRLGAGWADAAPTLGSGALCRRAPPTALEDGASVFLCPVARRLEAGAARRLDVTVRSAVGPDAGGGDLGLAFVGRRAGDGADDPAAPRPQATRVSAVGASASLRILSAAGGAPIEPALDLGASAQIAFDVVLFGLGAQELTSVTVALDLPPALRFASSRVVGSAAADAFLGPEPGGSGRLIWRLADAPGADALRFSARVSVSAEAASGGAEAAPGEDAATLRADVAFQMAGRVAPAGAVPATRAALPIALRSPDASVALRFVDADDPGALAPGGRYVVEAVFRNDGDGAAFVDWIDAALPHGFSVARLEDDGLDNDLDGAVDEPGEVAVADVVERRVRWTGVGLGVGRAARATPAGGEVRLPFAIEVADDAPPGAYAPIRLTAEAGAASAQAGSEDRLRLFSETETGVAAAEGMLIVTQIGARAGRGRAPRDGDEVRFRVRVELPPGAPPPAELIVDAPPAVSIEGPARLALGPGVDCAVAATAPERRARPRGRVALAYRIEGCRVASDAPDALRVIVLDVVARAIDADPSLSDDERALWRDARVRARLTYLDDAAPQVGFGEARLRLTGPLLRLDVMSARPGARDAGDPLSFDVAIRNVGDAPVEAAALRVEDAGAGPGFDCAAVRLRPAEAGPTSVEVDGAGCDADWRVAFEPPLEPGAVAMVRLLGRVASDAPRRADPSASASPLAIVRAWPVSASGSNAETGRAASAAAETALRGPETPSLTLAGADGPDGVLRVGDRFTLLLGARVGEGAGPAELEARVRLARPSGATVAGAAPLRLIAARLRVPSADVRGDGLAADAAGAVADVADAVRRSDGADGWTRFALDLGEIVVPSGPESGAADLFFEATFEVVDAPAAAPGRRIEAAAALALGGPPSVSPSLAIAPIAAPFLDAAALFDGDPPVARPGGSLIFEARVCNRGGAAAFGAGLAAALGPGVAFDLDADDAPRLVVAAPDAPLAGAPSAGRVDLRADGLTARSARPLPPGACLRVAAPVRLSPTLDGAPTAAVAALDHRSRGDADRPGRVYPTGAPVRSAAPRAPGGLDAVVVGAADARRIVVVVAGPAAGGPARVAVEVLDPAGVRWRAVRDVDGDGRPDPGEPPVRGEAVAPARLVFAPVGSDGRPDVGRRIALRAVGVAADGAPFAAATSVFVGPGGTDGARIAVDRRLALDRDCDGRLDDERTQDAAFEVVKPDAPGACAVVRLRYRNDGAQPAADLRIADAVPAGARLRPGSARPVETPPGVVAGPGRLQTDVLSFEVIGVLSPTEEGVLSYQIRFSPGD